jgi:hypothetical protein
MDRAAGPVECYSGGEYAERPRALHWEGARLEVAEVLQSWRSPEEVRFRVRTVNDRIFGLVYTIETDAWSIVEK